MKQVPLSLRRHFSGVKTRLLTNKMILALVALVYSQSFHLAPQEIESWNKVMQVGMSVSDNECSSEIQYAFNQATQTYKQNLLSPNVFIT